MSDENLIMQPSREVIKEQKKPILKFYTWKSIIAIFTTIASLFSGALVFGVKFQTDHLVSKLAKTKYEYELIIRKLKEEQIEKDKALNEYQKKRTEFISETVFLRISKQYSDAIAKYQQEENKKNLIILRNISKKFAYHVYNKKEELKKLVKTYDEKEYIDLSTTYFIFNNNIYYIPKSILLLVEQIERGKKL